MTDRKKIMAAASAYAKGTWSHEEERLSCMDGFMAGMERAQQEFINSLWHDASEKPKKGVTFLVSMCNHGDHKISYYLDDSGDVLETFTSWSAYVSYFGVTHWCYLDDIMPKEGGEG